MDGAVGAYFVGGRGGRVYCVRFCMDRMGWGWSGVGLGACVCFIWCGLFDRCWRGGGDDVRKGRVTW